MWIRNIQFSDKKTGLFIEFNGCNYSALNTVIRLNVNWKREKTFLGKKPSFFNN